MKKYIINGKEINPRIEYANGTSAEKSTSLLLEELLEALSTPIEKKKGDVPNSKWENGTSYLPVTCRNCRKRFWLKYY